MKNRIPSQFTLSLGLLICMTTFSCADRDGVQMTSSAFVANVSEAQQTDLQDEIKQHLTRISLAYQSSDRTEHAKETLALLAYIRGMPTFLLDVAFSDFMKTVSENGISPYLSIYIDWGRGLAEAKSANAFKAHQQMIELFAEQDEVPLNRQIVFLRNTTNWSSTIEMFSDNVGWAIAAIVFSDFGQNISIDRSLGLQDLLDMVQVGTTCANCLEDEEGEPAMISREGISAADRAEVSLEEFVGEDPKSSCDVINTGVALGMEENTQRRFCQATNDVKANGFSAAIQACFESLDDLVDGLIPESPDLWDRIQQFSDYVECQENLLSPRGHDPFFTDFSHYFTGTQAADDSTGGGTEIVIDDEGNASTKKTKTNEEGGTETTLEVFDGSGSSTAYVQVKDKDGGESYHKINRQLGQPSVTSHSNKEEFVAARMRHEAVYCKKNPRECARPDPEGGQSPCASILTGETHELPTTEDIGTLIQFDPYKPMEGLFESLNDCLENFDDYRYCEIRMLCIDERGDPECECDNFQGGIFGQTDFCQLVQCGADATLVNCICQTPDGGIIPGLGGPLFFGNLLNLGVHLQQ